MIKLICWWQGIRKSLGADQIRKESLSSTVSKTCGLSNLLLWIKVEVSNYLETWEILMNLSSPRTHKRKVGSFKNTLNIRFYFKDVSLTCASGLSWQKTFVSTYTSLDIWEPVRVNTISKPRTPMCIWLTNACKSKVIITHNTRKAIH